MTTWEDIRNKELEEYYAYIVREEIRTRREQKLPTRLPTDRR